MPTHPSYRATDRLAILLHHELLTHRGKTGLALLRFAPDRVAAVIDSDHAGQCLKELTGIPLDWDIPIVASAEAALKYSPQTLAIGIAPSGGKFPDAWSDDIRAALTGGLNVLNGLHTRLNDDERFRSLLKPGQWIWDMRKEPDPIAIANGDARLLNCKRVLFVGTDMSIGKMSAAIAMDRAARLAKLRSKFMATGQTGIMIAGDGIALDAVRIDFAAGAVQQEVIASAQDRDIVFIEGQGSLLNPASTATLPLLRGSQPTHMILVHRAQMHHLRDFRWANIPPLRDVVKMYEMVACAGGAFAPAKVAAIALNTHGLSEPEARYVIERTAIETDLPCDDVVRYGAARLLNTVLE